MKHKYLPIMRNYLIITCLCLNCIYSVNAQTSERAFYYDLVFSGDSTALENRGNDTMVLWTNGTYSVFQSYLAFKMDSLTASLKDNASSTGNVNIAKIMQAMSNIKKPIFKYIIHKDLIARQVDFYNEMFDNAFVYSDKLEDFKWEIKNEFKEILGYKCQLATTHFGGRDYIAWFAEDIPIQEGPYLFNGLPGLIMEIHDTRKHYNFILIGMKLQKVDLENIKIKNAISTTKTEYTKTRKKYYSNIQMALGDRAGSVDPESLKKVQERYNRANNPIELKH